MSADAQRAFIEKFLLNTFKSAHPTFKVLINNAISPKEMSRYVEYTDLAGDARQGELTGRSFDRAVGVLQIDIMVPEDSGSGELSRIGDWFNAMLKKQSFTLSDNSVLVFRVGSHRYIGVNSKMARQSFRIGYYRDDRRQGSA